MKYLRKTQKQNPKRKDLVFFTTTRSICNAGRVFAFPDIHFFLKRCSQCYLRRDSLLEVNMRHVHVTVRP